MPICFLATFRYLRKLHFSLKKGRWNSKEEEKLIELIEKHGVGKLFLAQRRAASLSATPMQGVPPGQAAVVFPVCKLIHAPQRKRRSGGEGGEGKRGHQTRSPQS